MKAYSVSLRDSHGHDYNVTVETDKVGDAPDLARAEARERYGAVPPLSFRSITEIRA